MSLRLKHLFYMGLGTIKGNLFKKYAPLDVMFSVTNKCPSRCNYCDITSRKQRELTTKEILKIIDEISKMGTQRLGLWGGEPLIREDIPEIITYAHKKGLYVTMDSNGYFLPDRINELKHLDHLVLSIDGPEQVHEKNREKGSFKKVIKAIETASGRIPFWSITVLTKFNIHHTDFILKLAREYGFQATFQIIHHNSELGKEKEPFLPDNEEIRAVFKKLLAQKRAGEPIASSTQYLEYIAKWHDYSHSTENFQVNGLKCWAGKLYCNIDTDGSVYPCSLQIGLMPALNAVEVGFEKAYRNIPPFSCKACTASCFIEHNFLYSLNFKTIYQRIKSLI